MRLPVLSTYGVRTGPGATRTPYSYSGIKLGYYIERAMAAIAAATLSQEQQELNALAKEVAVKLLTPEAITRAEFNEILTSSLAKLEQLSKAMNADDSVQIKYV